MSVWAPQYPRIEHVWNANVVRVVSRSRDLQWAIHALHWMIQQRVLVIWSPAWSAILINFDFNHLLDTVDDPRYANLLFWFGYRLLLLHECLSEKLREE
jgi:hypothetical protein